MGMPTVVVVGSNQHKVYYNGKGYTPSMDPLILAAIDSALLYNPTGIPEKPASGLFNIYPSPFYDRLTVTTSTELPGAEVILCDIYGKQLINRVLPSSGTMTVEPGSLPAGIYFAYLRSNGAVSQAKKLIKQ